SEELVAPALIALAFGAGLPLLATNEPYVAARDDYEAHDALLCIAEGRLVSDSDRRQLTPEHYFKTRAEMMELFADLPEALAASVEIARRCSFRSQSRAPILPRFSVGGKAADEAVELRRRAEAGLETHIKEHGLTLGFSEEEYRERLAFELD